jgi:peptidyl-tRNA hydrolase, PTH1 family
MVADALVKRWGLGRAKRRFRGRIVEGRVGAPAGQSYLGGPDASRHGGQVEGNEGESPGESREGRLVRPARPRVAVLCPQTYMNDAGSSVGPARGAFKLALERVVVVYDEIDLPFGEVRSRTGGGLAGHNGLKSIKHELGSADFTRVRVGVGRPDSTDPEIVSAYVLGRFREDPSEVSELVEHACEAVERLVLGATAAPQHAGSAESATKGERQVTGGRSRSGETGP